MGSVDATIEKLNRKLGSNVKTAFVAGIVIGLAAHLSIMVQDIPNHDGLDSIYFDQNMITSGRWFLSAACGVSSFFSLPWMIGILSILYLALAAAFSVDLLEIKGRVSSALLAGLMVSFPVLASNFAYVFTMDGYMLGLLLCIVAVWLVKKGRFGFIAGGVVLAFGMGTYQSYLSVTMLLTLYMILRCLAEEEKPRKRAVMVGKYFGMGAIGVALYYVILKLLLAIEGKTLDTYQGINGMADGNGLSLAGTVKLMYTDFVSFSVKGHVAVPNICAAVMAVVLLIAAIVSVFAVGSRSGLMKKPLFIVTIIAAVLLIPAITNAILLISANVTYHVLMRYQWVVFGMVAISLVEWGRSVKTSTAVETKAGKKAGVGGWGHKSAMSGKVMDICEWAMAIAVLVLIVNYIAVDNIAYSNLNKKYEKTYAYCLRLVDRIEQTEGYYQGIPIAMVGVVGEDNFPVTDVTGDVTGSLLGISGDYLLYKGENYQRFIKHYLGATLNILPDTYVSKFYNDPMYAAMPSFPDDGSIVVSDGVMYIKTENIR